MHRALLISEILNEIFAKGPRGSCVVAAQVCQAWKDPALDLIWRTLYNPWNIFSVFRITEYGFLQLPKARFRRRAKRDSNWTRFHQYSHRVRSIVFHELDTQKLEIIIAKEIIRFAPTGGGQKPLFPALRKLHATTQTQLAYSLALDFVSSTLTTLFIQTSTTIEKVDHTHIFFIIPVVCPDLVELDCRPPLPTTNMGEQMELATDLFADMILGNPRLKRLTIHHSLSQKHLDLLSLLPNVELVRWFHCPEWSEYDRKLPGEFPSLRTLEGCFSNLDCPIWLLRDPALQNKLHSLIIRVAMIADYPPLQVLSLVESIALHSATLGSFAISLDHILSAQGMPPPDSVHSFTQLQPLFQCRHLTALQIGYNGQLLLDDEELGNMVASFPKLQYIALLPSQLSRGLRSVPTLMLACLKFLVHHCHDLEAFNIYLDARHTSRLYTLINQDLRTDFSLVNPVLSKETSAEGGKLTPLENLTAVGFGYSPILHLDEVRVATYLLSLTAKGRLEMLNMQSPLGLETEDMMRARCLWSGVAMLVGFPDEPEVHEAWQGFGRGW